MTNNEIINVKISKEDVISTFCYKLKNNPDEFYLIDFTTVNHSSGIWFNAEEEIMGYIYTYKDIKDKQREEKRFYQIEESQKQQVSLACIKWFDWYDDKKSEILIDNLKNFVYEEEESQ